MENELEKYPEVYNFVALICLRNQLLTYPLDVLVEAYSKLDDFKFFLDSVRLLRDNDSGFLLLSEDALKKISEVIENGRFKYKGEGVTDICNELIVYLNDISALSEKFKEITIREYFLYQSDVRGITIEDKDALFDALESDAVVYSSFVNNALSDLDDRDILVLSSINYFLEACPKLFENDEFYRINLNKVDELRKKGWPFLYRVNREYASDTLKVLEKVRQKGE